ncbi:helix-turn-helix domain-containing protein [Nonomuraea angiospora]
MTPTMRRRNRVREAQTAPDLVKPYFSDETTATESTLLSDVGLLRTQASTLSSEIEDTHHAMQGIDIRQRASVKVRKGVPTLLEELTEDRGMSWSDVARLVGVSVSAVRKWRTGGQASPEKRKELAELAAFLDVLEESSVEDPARWLEVPFYLPAGYTVRPVELYIRGHRTELLDVACGRRDAEDVLDAAYPSWRETRRSSLEVFTAADGLPALRARDS